jgi:hypothetical protein
MGATICRPLPSTYEEWLTLSGLVMGMALLRGPVAPCAPSSASPMMAMSPKARVAGLNSLATGVTVM